MKNFLKRQYISLLVLFATILTVTLNKVVSKLVALNVIESKLIKLFVTASPSIQSESTLTADGKGNKKKQLVSHFVPKSIANRLYTENEFKRKAKLAQAYTAEDILVYEEIKPDAVIVIDREPESAFQVVIKDKDGLVNMVINDIDGDKAKSE